VAYTYTTICSACAQKLINSQLISLRHDINKNNETSKIKAKSFEHKKSEKIARESVNSVQLVGYQQSKMECTAI